MRYWSLYEDRYMKAFGAGLISFEKFQDLMKDVRGKENAITSQAKEVLVVNEESEVNTDDIDSVCSKVLLELQCSSVADRQNHLRKMIESIYVGERNGARVKGRIPLTTQAQNIQDEPINRNCRSSQCGEVHTF